MVLGRREVNVEEGEVLGRREKPLGRRRIGEVTKEGRKDVIASTFISEQARQAQAEPVYSRVSKIKHLSCSLEDMAPARSESQLSSYQSDDQLLCDDQTDAGSTWTNPYYRSNDSELASAQTHEYSQVTRQDEHVTLFDNRRVTPEWRHMSQKADQEITPALPEQEITPVLPDQEITPVLPDQEITPVLPEQEVTPALPDRPAEESTENPNIPHASVRSQRRQRDNGSVQLLSVRGVSDHLPESRSMYFPVGASADMASTHYAAATGNKEALEVCLSTLRVLQDPVEMVLGSDRLCRLEGVDAGDSEGRTPLMHAAHGNHLQCVQLLVGVGANVNTTAKGLVSTCQFSLLVLLFPIPFFFITPTSIPSTTLLKSIHLTLPPPPPPLP